LGGPHERDFPASLTPRRRAAPSVAVKWKEKDEANKFIYANALGKSCSPWTISM
jgi:hypothetical protein